MRFSLSPGNRCPRLPASPWLPASGGSLPFLALCLSLTLCISWFPAFFLAPCLSWHSASRSWIPASLVPCLSWMVSSSGLPTSPGSLHFLSTMPLLAPCLSLAACLSWLPGSPWLAAFPWLLASACLSCRRGLPAPGCLTSGHWQAEAERHHWSPPGERRRGVKRPGGHVIGGGGQAEGRGQAGGRG